MNAIKITCSSETETTRLAETVSLILKPGDLITLDGDLGAGKTTFTRALIRAAMQDPHAEVPSPTFTLLQIYEGFPFGKLAHLDLYRIEHPDELDELGLDEILQDGVGFVEWPVRAQDNLPKITATMKIVHLDETGRHFQIDGQTSFLERLNRSLEIRAFLDKSGHGSSKRHHLTGDASARAYETITPEKGPSVILMNAPAQPDGPPIKNGLPYSKIARLAEDMSAFVGVSILLEENGFRVPHIEAMDLDRGLLLIENLGTGSVLDDEGKPVEERYLACSNLLAAMHEKTWKAQVELPNGDIHIVPPFDRNAMMIEVDLLKQWYVPYRLGRELDLKESEQFDAIWDRLITELNVAETSILLRDYHSPNIIWMDHESGQDRIGLIDFQDALIGPTAYDLASLAQDARVDVSEELEAKLVHRYCAQRSELDETEFRSAYAIMAAERATKVLGIFVRLSKRDGKHGYLKHLSRIENYLQRSLQHPLLNEYNQWLNSVLKFDST